MRFLIAVFDSGTTTAMPGEMQAIDAPDVATAHVSRRLNPLCARFDLCGDSGTAVRILHAKVVILTS